MSSAAPLAAIAPAAAEIVRGLAPSGVDVQALTDDTPLDRVSFLVPKPMDRSILERLAGMESLEVVQTLSAGTDRFDDAVGEHVTLCSARGARDAPVAEWVLGALLGFGTRLLLRARDRRWDRRPPLTDFAGTRVLIVGMGSIGRAVAARIAPFGAEVVGVASTARDGMHGVDELPELLPTADHVVVLAPLTDATRQLIDARALSAMKDGALLVNAGRGAVVDTEALLAQTGGDPPRLYAVLDVTDPEPLPADHPLWGAPGVLSITPHIGGDSRRGHEAAARLAGEQLARWHAGEPLRNVVKQGKEPA